jgi:hypothetical protein
MSNVWRQRNIIMKRLVVSGARRNMTQYGVEGEEEEQVFKKQR